MRPAGENGIGAGDRGGCGVCVKARITRGVPNTRYIDRGAVGAVQQVFGYRSTKGDDYPCQSIFHAAKIAQYLAQ